MGHTVSLHPGSPGTGWLALGGGGEGLSHLEHKVSSLHPLHSHYLPVCLPQCRQSTNSIFSQTHHMNKRWEELSLGTLGYASTLSRMWILKHVLWSHFSVCVGPSLPRVLCWTPAQHPFPTPSLTLLCLGAQMASRD